MIFNTVNCTKCEQTFSDSASLEDHTKHSHVEASFDINEECMNKLDLLEKEQKAERQKFTHAFSEEEKSKLKAVKEVEELKLKIIVEKEEKEKREKDIIKKIIDVEQRMKVSNSSNNDDLKRKLDEEIIKNNSTNKELDKTKADAKDLRKKAKHFQDKVSQL